MNMRYLVIVFDQDSGRRTQLQTSARALVLFFPALLANQAVANGGEPGSRDKAQQLRNDGAAALERGDAATASEDFRRAYELFASPNLLYDLGLALDRLGRCAEAVDAFESFLERAPNALPAARSFATSRLTALESCVGRLELTDVPAAARVAVDGRAVELPRTRPLPVTPGERLVTVEKRGFVTRVEHVAVSVGERHALALTLVPEPAPVARVEQRPALVLVPRPQPVPAPTRHLRPWAIAGIVGGAVAVSLSIGLGVGLGVQPSDPKASIGVAALH
jgi:tetratricopeptide (TPR) repeat protein